VTAPITITRTRATDLSDVLAALRFCGEPREFRTAAVMNGYAASV
jgi:hypothetical protein